MATALKINLWPFSLHFRTHCCLFLFCECLIGFLSPRLFPSQLLFKIPFSLCFLNFYLIYFVCVCVWYVCGNQPTYATYGQRITCVVWSTPHLYVFFWNWTQGFRLVQSIFSPTEPYHLPSLCFFSDHISLCCSVVFKLTVSSRPSPSCMLGLRVCTTVLGFWLLFKFKLWMYIHVWACTCECMCLQRREVLDPIGVQIYLIQIGAGNQTLQEQPWHLSAPWVLLLLILQRDAHLCSFLMSSSWCSLLRFLKNIFYYIYLLFVYVMY